MNLNHCRSKPVWCSLEVKFAKIPVWELYYRLKTIHITKNPQNLRVYHWKASKPNARPDHSMPARYHQFKVNKISIVTVQTVTKLRSRTSRKLLLKNLKGQEEFWRHFSPKGKMFIGKRLCFLKVREIQKLQKSYKIKLYKAIWWVLKLTHRIFRTMQI